MKKCKVNITRVPFLTSIVVLVGCSRSPARVEQPQYRSDCGQAAVEQLDRNGDGLITSSELAASPALKSASARIDTNHDGAIDAEEINRAVSAWIRSRVALMPVTARIFLDGRPLADADITLEPEQFVGVYSHPVAGKTDSDGDAPMKGSDSRAPGAPLGWYRVVISKKNGAQETLPERFNSKTELGLEVTPESAMNLQPVTWNLRSR
jgi:hypothetical protein